MKKLIVLVMIFILVACTPPSTPPTPATRSVPTIPTDTPTSPPISEPSDTPPPNTQPQGVIISVTSTADSGPGSFRQAMLDAQPYDTITFDPVIFPPDTPATIYIISELPHIHVSYLTIDASNAGVILSGEHASGGWTAGLQIVSAEGVTVRGFQFTHFPEGIAISGEATNNVIGGDPGIGNGPLGQGNMFVQNGNGIDVSTDGASFNTIIGNLIGTNLDGSEDVGNYGDGVVIWEGAHDNTVGPDNIIAFNGGAGVVFRHAQTHGNTITQNSIYSNYSQDISLLGGSNASLPAPLILGFDLKAGTINGLACPDCNVEIYSDQGNAGEIFEGQITADNAGEFTFSKDGTFSGANLTTTSTDLNGNTSQFSQPTWGETGEQELQRGNDLPITQLLTKSSAELVDNRIGAQLTELSSEDSSDLWVYPIGVKRARVTITGIEPELVDWSKPEFSVSPGQDAFISRLIDNGIRITYTLMFWDKDTYPNGEGAPCARFKTQAEVDRWLEYVRFTVKHFKDEIQYYEIWNEPDIRGYCPKWIEAEDYINLVKQTVPVIKEIHPQAKVVVGAISNTRFEQDYLFELLESDIMPLVGGISWHPMYSPSPEYDVYRDYYETYPDFVQKIKETALAHGFSGEFQADEIGWATIGHAVADQPWEYTATKSDKYWGRGIVQNLGLDVNVGLGENNAVAQNLCTIMAGALPVDLTIDVQNSATNTLSYTFSLADGGYLVGLWTNGIAMEYGPGVESTIVIQGVSASKVVGIDSLYGFEQELNFEIENGNLVIRDLLVKDYPIIIKLIDVSP